MLPGKMVAAALACCAVGASVVPWFVSYLLALLLGQGGRPIHAGDWWTFQQHLHEPAYKPFAWRVWTAGALGAALPLLMASAVVLRLCRTGERALHGSARFASRRHLKRAGLLSPSPHALVVGRRGRRLLYMGGQQFALLAAPTRSGKGVGVVIPNLLHYGGSVVVLDIKQENFDLTSGWRHRQGHDVHLFNPFAEDGRTARWNPLHYVSSGIHRISDIMSLAEILYPETDRAQAFWVSQARNAFLAFALYLFDRHDAEGGGSRARPSREPTLGDIFRLSTGDGSDFRTYLQALSRAPFLGGAGRNAFNNLLSQQEETFASIMGTFREPLNIFINLIVDAATRGNDFLLTDVRRKPITIYIGVQPNKLAESRLLLNLFFSQLIKLNTAELPSQNPELTVPCLLLMDEFTSIGRVDILAHAVSFIAGYNLRLLPIIQSLSQLSAVYGDDVARTFVTNHALQIVYTPREQRDANEYSDMLGYTTVRRKNVTTGRERSVSHSDERRALMLPQELKAMSQEKEVIFYESLGHPVMADKIRYYKEARFRKRLLPAVEVPRCEVVVE